MELGTFTPRPAVRGDQLPARDVVDRPLVVLVREHRMGIQSRFRTEPADGVVLDVADITSDSVWIDVLWMNGAVVDGLAPYVGQAVPIKLTWTPSAKGGNPYIAAAPLEGADLARAQQWAAANPNRFEQERAKRAAAQAATGGAPQVPGAPTNPPSFVPLGQAPATAPAAPAPVAPAPAPAAAPANPTDPAVQALLAQIAAGQTPPTA